MNSEIEIRILKTSADMYLIQKLEREIWNMDPLPVHQTITASQNGGLLLGAFLHQELIGFNYGFAGFQSGKGYLCSHMLGIDPKHRDKGIGALLKAKQKQFAAELGYDLITWTFDPLESRNAYLNLAKLRAICSTYVENCYGEMEDSLNNGLPSDRLKVEWWISSSHVKEPYVINFEKMHCPFQWRMTEESLPEFLPYEDLDLIPENNDEPILVPIPANFQIIKKKNYQLALNWRLSIRKVLQSLFAKDYALVSFLKEKEKPVHHYVMVPKNRLDIK
ncbi:GNAT family N-acetyltransferase [Cytobacillus praedii]|uniref:GNAT family N-acetyltransferase n=1 Tax=Cytobacillus praedii TaxID=1742358 RepID=A0A4R1AQL0_9BACI|nr:GNAT family N-acetyltransferase [Cytobacillus praedii]TCJ02281.1 GNAT family N-acetyltransferase [Cytobacillus praedii]